MAKKAEKAKEEIKEPKAKDLLKSLKKLIKDTDHKLNLLEETSHEHAVLRGLKHSLETQAKILS